MKVEKLCFCVMLLLSICTLIPSECAAFRDGFIENNGQFSDMNGNSIPDVMFKFEQPGMNIWITKTGLTYQFFDLKKRIITDSSNQNKVTKEHYMEWSRTDLILENTDLLQKQIVYGDNISTENLSFYSNRHPEGLRNVRTFDHLTFKNVYNGIDWVIYLKQDHLKYEFVVHPNANASQIQLRYKGDGRLDVTSHQLSFSNQYGHISEGELYCYQADFENQIQANYKVENSLLSNPTNTSILSNGKTSKHFNSLVSINLEDYDRTQKLIIDPIINWGTIYGGNGNDGVLCVETDLIGNIFNVGYSLSTDFPVLDTGTYFFGTGPNMAPDLFIQKFSPTGDLLWSTYYGSSAMFNQANSVCIDSQNNVWVTGVTNDPEFPTQNSGTFFQNENTIGLRGGFLLKFDNDGNRLLATFIAGEFFDEGTCVHADSQDNIWLTGTSNSANFPVMDAGTFFDSTPEYYEAFLMKFDLDANLLWSTFIGGQFEDRGIAIGSDDSNVWLVGNTFSSNFPTVDNGTFFQGTITGQNNDLFITKFDLEGNLEWSTFYGGTGIDSAVDIVVDNVGDFWVCGSTNSTDFPTQDAGTFFQGNAGGLSDLTLIKFDNTGNRILSTYLAGSDSDSNLCNNNLAVDECNNLYFSMGTRSAEHPLNTNNCDYQDGFHNTDIYLGMFDPEANLLWSTYFGGTGLDYRPPLTLDNEGFLILAGEYVLYSNEQLEELSLQGSGSTEPFDNTVNGADDSFVYKFDKTIHSTNVSPINETDCNSCDGRAVTQVNCSYPPYDFEYSNGVQHLNTNIPIDTLTQLCAGDYWVKVTSNCNQIDTTWFTISNSCACVAPPVLELVSFENEICNNQDGFISVAVEEGTGTGPLNFSWSNSLNGSLINNLSAGDYQVVVLDSIFCSDTLSINLIDFSGINIDLTYENGCLDQELSFIDHSLSSTGDLVNWTWDFGGENFELSQITSQAFSTPGNHTIQLSIENENGCQADTIFEVLIMENPIASFTTESLCSESSTNFLNTSTSELGEITTLSWNFGDGGSSNTENGLHSYSSPGIYQVTLEIETELGCSDTITSPVEVFTNPSPSFLAEQDPGCGSNVVTFIDNSNVQGSSIFTWNWDFGDGTSSIDSDPIHQYSEQGNFNVSLIIESTQGCTNELNSILNIEILNTPEALFSFELDPDSTPFGEVNFTNESTGENSLSWDFGDGSNNNQDNNPTHIFSSNNEFFNVILTALDTNTLCSDTASTTIHFTNNLSLYVPNAFTPFSDNLNDIFLPILSLPVDDYHIVIFDSWGTIVYESNDQYSGWNGAIDESIAQDGIYMWKIKFRNQFEDDELFGHIVVMR